VAIVRQTSARADVRPVTSYRITSKFACLRAMKMTTFKIPTLNTDRLRLRAFEANDLDAYAAMRARVRCGGPENRRNCMAR
jgi:hypothetical protein